MRWFNCTAACLVFYFVAFAFARKCSVETFQDAVNRMIQANSNQRRHKVFVSGAAGFIGSHVADFCLRLKFDVVGVDDLSGGFERNLQKFLRKGGIFVKGDLKNVSFVQSVFLSHGPFTFIYHIAAYAAEGLSHFIRKYNYENNLIASVNILNEAVKQEPIARRFIFTSSIAAFGKSDGVLPLNESSPMLPEDPYGIAKMAFELDLKAAHHMFGLNYTIFRPHNVYGPRQNIADKFRNVIGIVMNQILRNETITVFGDGMQRRAFSFIADVAVIISGCVAFDEAENNDFFIGNDEAFTINELVRVVLLSMGVPNHTVVHLPARNEVIDAFPSHEKLRCIFNPPETVNLTEGILQTAKSVREHGPFEPTGYMNVEVYKRIPHSWHTWLTKSSNFTDTTLSKVDLKF